jgi:hypothetical protein
VYRHLLAQGQAASSNHICGLYLAAHLPILVALAINCLIAGAWVTQ